MGIIHLYKENPKTYQRQILGTITENQLEFLIDNLEEEFEEEEVYLLNADSISFLKDQSADKSLIALLEKALADTKGCVDIFYTVE
jgi:hypothetical protein